MAIKVSRVREELADREAIRDTLIQYSRMVDRLDLQISTQIFWPEATDDHAGTYRGDVASFMKFVEPVLRSMQQTQHFLANLTIRISGDRANTETYVFAFHDIRNEDGAVYSLIGGGRLLDTLEKRDDEWRILERTLLVDWMKKVYDPAGARDDLEGHIVGGRRYPDDPSHRHFP